MTLGTVLYEPGQPITHAYFPTSSIVSLLYITRDGATAEFAVVGNDGVIGMALYLGGRTSLGRAVVESEGVGFRISAQNLATLFEREAALRTQLLRFAQAVTLQACQTAVCNRHHRINQQLCRRILLSLDRLGGSELNMTQELMANMLGVRREGVTQAARKLQQLHAIEYNRGHVKVLRRSLLEEQACECYGVIKQGYERIFDAAP
jgi:CRP-like cAMP-binding protein